MPGAGLRMSSYSPRLSLAADLCARRALPGAGTQRAEPTVPARPVRGWAPGHSWPQCGRPAQQPGHPQGTDAQSITVWRDDSAPYLPTAFSVKCRKTFTVFICNY